MPEWAAHVRPRLSSLRLSPAREAEIVEELSQHLEDRWQELVASGVSREDATRLTLADFQADNLLARYLAPLRQSQTPPPIAPGTPRGSLVSDLAQDLRYAVRTLRKRPVFAIAAVLTLAIGIGSNAAIFTVINAVLLRPLDFPNSGQLRAVYMRYLPATGFDFPFFSLSPPEFNDIRTRVDALAGIAAYRFGNVNLTRGDGESERILTLRVTAPFFDVLGVKPARGRTFTEEEAQRSKGCLAVIGDDMAAANDGVIGSSIRLDDVPCDVIGVMPKGFTFRDDRVKVWTALAVDTAENPNNRNSHPLSAIARLRDGVSAEHADAQLRSLWTYWSEQFPDHYAKGHFAFARPLHDDIIGDQRDALLLVGSAVVVVLLIVCVNLAALLVTNGEARRREFAVRYALGANRRRLVRQLITEAMVLAAIGGVLGILIANTLLAALLALYPQRLPVSQAIAIDATAVLYTSLVIIMAGILVGVVPALHATGTRMQDTMRADTRTSTSSRRAVAARSVLVVSQLALSVILLAGALLLIRSYQRLQMVNLGIDPEHVLTFSLSIPPGRQPDPAAARRTLLAIEDRLATTPGVETAGAISNLPLASAGPPDSFVIEGRPQPPPGAPSWSARYLMTTPRMFRALAIPLKRGRLLAESDVVGQPLVAVINETAARMFWAGDDPIGRTIRYYPQDANPSIQIVGVVGDVRSIGAGQPAPPAVYVSLAQAPRPPYTGRAMTFLLRTPGDPAAVIASARAAIAAVDTGLPPADVRTMTDVIARASGQPRFTTLVMSFFAGLAFFLGGLGLYGTLAYSVEQRIREIGVRVALGADKGRIVRLIVGNGMRLVFVGLLIGVPAALGVTRLMRGMLSDVSSSDPLTYIAVVAMLMICALLASYLPARRAIKVDPIVALRTE